MYPWKKFRIAFTLFTGFAIISIYALNGMFSSAPIKSVKEGLHNFYTAELIHCQVTDASEIHFKAKRSHVLAFKVDCNDHTFTFLPETGAEIASSSITPGNFISKAANDYNFILTNTTGDVQLSMVQPNEASIPFHWEFPLIMGSFIVINFCIFFIFPKRYFSSEANPK